MSATESASSSFSFDGGGAQDSSLLDEFRSFCARCLELKTRIQSEVHSPGLEGLAVVAPDEAPPIPVPGASLVPSEILQELARALETQTLRHSRGSGSTSNVPAEARYIMAALADEIFLNLDWHGTDYWSTNLLEARFFRTHRAGEFIFRGADAFLADPSPARVQVGWMYLLALGLGFRGKYRGDPGADEQIASYKRRLLAVLSGWEPELGASDSHLFPEAYSSTLGGKGGARLPYLRKWVIGIATILVGWAVIAHFVWRSLTVDLWNVLTAIPR